MVRRGGFRGCRAGARSHTFRVAGGRFGDPAPSTVWLRKALRLARTHCAHPLARRPRVLVARQHAVSEPTSLTCGTWTGKRLPDHTLGPPHGARALVVHARARRVGRGGNERAHTARAIASRGRIGGGARCTPRGRGRRPRGRGRVTGARGSHNDKGAILGGFWDAWKAARKCDFFFCQTRLQSGDKFVISLRAHILRDAARTPSTGPACCGAHRFFGCVSKVGRVDSLRETEGRPWTGGVKTARTDRRRVQGVRVDLS